MPLPLLPTDTVIDPNDMRDHEYHGPSDVLYLFEGSDCEVIAASSAGRLGPDVEVGSRHRVVHDQTDDEIGDFTVVGIVDDSERGPVAYAGAVAHYVFK